MQIFTLATVLRYFESRDLRDPSVAKLTTYHDIERPFAGYDALVHADRSHVYKVKYNANSVNVYIHTRL